MNRCGVSRKQSGRLRFTGLLHDELAERNPLLHPERGKGSVSQYSFAGVFRETDLPLLSVPLAGDGVSE
jgi:hypothetical protein